MQVEHHIEGGDVLEISRKVKGVSALAHGRWWRADAAKASMARCSTNAWQHVAGWLAWQPT